MEATNTMKDCPISVHGATVDRQGGGLRVEVTLTNPTGHRVESVDAVAAWRLADGTGSVALPVHSTGLNLHRQCMVHLRLPNIGRIREDSFSLTFMRVEYGDGTPEWLPMYGKNNIDETDTKDRRGDAEHFR